MDLLDEFYIRMPLPTVFPNQTANLKAESPEDLKKNFAKSIMDCAHDFPLTSDDIEQLKTKQFPDKETVKCLFACVYKNFGMLNDEGQLSAEGVKTVSEKYFSGDPEKIKKSEDFTQACLTVNDVAVSDGNKGCERAALIFKCSIEKAPQFGLI